MTNTKSNKIKPREVGEIWTDGKDKVYFNGWFKTKCRVVNARSGVSVTMDASEFVRRYTFSGDTLKPVIRFNRKTIKGHVFQTSSGQLIVTRDIRRSRLIKVLYDPFKLATYEKAQAEYRWVPAQTMPLWTYLGKTDKVVRHFKKHGPEVHPAIISKMKSMHLL